MNLLLSNHIAETWDDPATRTIHEKHEVRAETEDGEFIETFTVSYCPIRGRGRQIKQLLYHLNVARNRVTRRAIEKRYGEL